MNKTLIVIAGPTAAGKTALAIQLALHYRTEIISADSRQFYKEMDIGTAKPSAEELSMVKHHLVNSHSINDLFSVGDFEKEVLTILDQLFKDHNQVILVGGSGLFINAVFDGFDDLPKAPQEIRDSLNLILEKKGIVALQERLLKVDPQYFGEVDIHNPQRLIRALEVFESTGKPFSSYRTKVKKKRDFNLIKLAISPSRAQLYEQINFRVDLMIKQGLIEEVRALQEHRGLNTLNTVGYSELFEYLEGKCTKEDAIEKIKQNTRRFAKRQITWFKRSEDMKWYAPSEHNFIIKDLDDAVQGFQNGEQKN